MKKAYIILAHKNPRQLLQLTARLDDDQSEFFIHIDRKADLNQFKAVINYSSKVHLVDREFTKWGGFSLVKATLNALRVIHSLKQFDRIILLSGQDYPVKSNEYINGFLRAASTNLFMDYTTIPDYSRWHTTGGMYRMNKYFLGMKFYERYAAKALNLITRFLPALQRTLPNGLKPFAGSQWWVIDNYAVQYILDYVKNNPSYTAFHKHTFAPDEVYFQTILLNSTDEKIAGNITNNNLMYTRWLHASSSHPEIITRYSVEEMVASESLFARKFEQETDNEVFNLVNESCNQLDHKNVQSGS